MLLRIFRSLRSLLFKSILNFCELGSLCCRLPLNLLSQGDVLTYSGHLTLQCPISTIITFHESLTRCRLQFLVFGFEFVNGMAIGINDPINLQETLLDGFKRLRGIGDDLDIDFRDIINESVYPRTLDLHLIANLRDPLFDMGCSLIDA